MPCGQPSGLAALRQKGTPLRLRFANSRHSFWPGYLLIPLTLHPKGAADQRKSPLHLTNHLLVRLHCFLESRCEVRRHRA